MPQFKRKDGSLTAYAFACGYIQREYVNGIRIDLFHEGAVYHVKLFNESLPYLDWNANGSGRRWETLGTLAEARKQFAAWKRQAK